jgi:uncharacterized coiled-coil DUF342 family protein
MPKTRLQAAQKRAAGKERTRRYRASLTPEKKAALAKRRRENRRIISKIDQDRAQHLNARVKHLVNESKAAKRRIDALNREVAELKEKYVLLADEPDVDPQAAKAAEEAFE